MPLSYTSVIQFLLEPTTGLEPVTSSLPRKCSTAELRGPRLLFGLERETGFEPATPSLEGSCSSQLSYSRPRASVEHRFQISCSRLSEFPKDLHDQAPPVTVAIRSLELESRTPGALRMVERGGFEPPKAEPADLQSAPFDRFGTSPVRQSSLNTNNTRRSTPHSCSCAVRSPLHPQAERFPAIGCECRMSNCCYFLSASPICFFWISSLCREPFSDCISILLSPFPFPNDCAPDLELAMGLEPATC